MADNKTSIIISAVDQTEGALKNINSNLGQLEGQFNRLSGVVSGFAALAGATAFAGIIKGAVDSAAGLHDLSQQTGASVESLSTLKGAAKLAGVDLEQVGSGLSKLSKNMLEAASGSGDAAKVFQALGISVKDANGNLKSSDAVFLEFSKSLQTVSSGTEKAAAAQLVLGKSGAQLLPLMNDLAATGQYQAKITAEQAAAADELQDTLTKLGAVQRSWVNTVAMEVVPAANAFASALLDTMTASNGVKKTAEELAKDGSIKAWAMDTAKAAGFVVDAMDGVKRVVQGVGITLAAAAAQASLIAQGEFKQAMSVGQEWLSDLDKIASKELFSDVLARRLAEIGKEAPAASGGIKSLAGVLSEAGNEAAKAAKALENLRLDQMKLVTKQAVAELDALAKAEADYYAALQKAADPLRQQAANLEQQVEFYGMTDAAIQETIVSRLEEAKAIAAQNGAFPEHLKFLQDEIDARKRIGSAASQKDFLDANKKAAEAAAREWEKFADDINRSLTDALFRAFESGGSFAENFAKTLTNTIKTALAKALIQAAVTTGSNALNGVINAIAGTSGSNGGAGTNYFGLANNASSLYNLYGAATGYSSSVNSLATLLGAGSSVGASSASLAYANAVGAAGGDSLGALIAANGSWSGVSTGAAAGSTAAGGSAGSAGASTAGLSVGTVAWVAAIVYGMYMSNQLWNQGVTWDKTYRDKYQGTWLYQFDTIAQMRDIMDQPARSLFGDGFVNSEWYSTLTGGSLSAAIHAQIAEALLGATRMLGSSMKGVFSESGFNDGLLGINMKKTGGLFSSSRTWTDWQALPNQVDSILDGLYQATKAVYLKIGETVDDTNLAEKLKAFIYAYQSATKTAESTVVDFATLINEAGVGLADAMGKYLFPSIASMAASGEAWSATFQRVVNEVASVDAIFKQLGTTLSEQFGKNNADRVLKLADSLVQAFGGLDAMGSAVQKYYAGYYSQTEQKDNLRSAFEQQFAALGVSMPETRTQFRRLVESLDLTSASGQKTYASLINMAEGFGVWADSLSSSTNTVADSIETALSGLFDSLLNQITDARSGVASARDAVNGIGVMSAAQIGAAINAASPAAPSGNAILTTQQTLQQTIAGSNTAIANAIAARDAEQAAVNERNRGWAYRVADLPNIFSSAEENSTQYAEMLRISQQLAALGFNAAFSASFGPHDSRATFGALPAGYQYFLDGRPVGSSLQLNHGDDWASVNGNYWQANSGARNLDLYAYKPYGTETINASYDQAIATAKATGAASITAAENAAIQAQEDYAKAIRQYVVDASKAVDKLNSLRDETVKYYEAQQQLANILLTSAANLREAVKQARQSQLSEAELLAQKRSEFAQSYSLALATTGTVQAGYADKMAAALPSLVAMLEQQAASQVDWARATGQLFAQSNTIAGQLESTASVDYQSESLALLNAIDLTLAIIETNAASAEKIISDAVYETGKTTADGLRAVIAAINGDPIPTFATGGSFTGGWRIVGENGPELEATGPSRIFTASQTRSILAGAGGMDAIVEELRALRAENADLRAEVRAVATHTYESAKNLKVLQGDGIIVRTEAGAPLETTAA